MELFSWRLVLVVIGVIVVCTLTIAGALMAPLQRPNTPSSRGGYFQELRECLGVMKTAPMLALSANNFLFCFGQAIVYVHLGAFAVSSGILTKSATATVFSIIGVSNLVGRVVHGVVCHLPQMSTLLVFSASTLVTSASTLSIIVCSNVTSLAVCASVFGFASCCLGALMPDIIIGLVGERRLAVSYSYLMLFEAAGFMLGAPFAGLMFDRTLTYLSSFYTAGAVLLLAALVMAVPWRYRHASLLQREGDLEGGSSSSGDPEVGRPETPVKEPAQPSDFVLPPTERGAGQVDGALQRSGEVEGEEQRSPRPADDGTCSDPDVSGADDAGQESDAEKTRLVTPESHTERSLRSNDAPAALVDEGSRLLAPDVRLEEDQECSGSLLRREDQSPCLSRRIAKVVPPPSGCAVVGSVIEASSPAASAGADTAAVMV